MQTYGNFFNPPKPENQIVDKWRIAGGKNYFTRFTSMYSVPVLFLVSILGRATVLAEAAKAISPECFSDCLIFTT
jgi:hypothetical protein